MVEVLSAKAKCSHQSSIISFTLNRSSDWLSLLTRAMCSKRAARSYEFPAGVMTGSLKILIVSGHWKALGASFGLSTVQK